MKPKKKMNTEKAIEVKKAIFTLSELLDIEPQELVNSICLLDKDRFSKIRSASDVKRGKMLGFEISVSPNGSCSS